MNSIQFHSKFADDIYTGRWRTDDGDDEAATINYSISLYTAIWAGD